MYGQRHPNAILFRTYRPSYRYLDLSPTYVDASLVGALRDSVGELCDAHAASGAPGSLSWNVEHPLLVAAPSPLQHTLEIAGLSRRPRAVHVLHALRCR